MMNTNTALQLFPTSQAFVNSHNNNHDGNKPVVFNNYFAGDSSPENQIQYHQYDSSSTSDCESGVTGSSSATTSSATSGHRHRRREIFSEGVMIGLSEDEKAYEVISKRFLAGVGGEEAAKVVAIHRKNWLEGTSMARVQAFQVYANALECKHGGPPAFKFGWYGGDKDTIQHVLTHGFSFLDLRFHNAAVALSPDPAVSMEDSGSDEEGLRHVLLCCVLLGCSEVVVPGSGQTYPSSNEFDTGVDSLDDPKKYIIWSSQMNTHILPEYVITFRAKRPKPQSPPVAVSRITANDKIRSPQSPWISFPALILSLARYLPKDDVALITKYHKDYKEKRLIRTEFIQKVRQIAGDKLLKAVIKSWKGHKELVRMLISKSRNTINK